MEALGFILQRFYYSLAGGCIINFFIIANVYILASKCTLVNMMKWLNSLTGLLLVVIFFVFAVIFSVILEGICEVNCQIIFQDEIKKKQTSSKCIVKKIYKKFIKHFFYNLGVLNASIRRKKNPLYHIKYLIKESKQKWNVPYEVVYVFAKIIEQKEKNANIYRFRDMSFLIQTLILSFLIISFFSGIAFIIFGILLFVYNCTKVCNQFIIYGIFFFVSLVFIIILPPIASKFSDRFIRDVGRTYMAYKLKEELFPEKAPDTQGDSRK